MLRHIHDTKDEVPGKKTHTRKGKLIHWPCERSKSPFISLLDCNLLKNITAPFNVPLFSLDGPHGLDQSTDCVRG